MKPIKIIYFISTGLFCAWMVTSGGMFLSQSGVVADQVFTPMGVPTVLVVPIGIAKILGVVALLFVKSALIKRLAYAGFAIDFVAAIFFHIKLGDGQWPAAAIAIVLMLVSYVSWNRTSQV